MAIFNQLLHIPEEKGHDQGGNVRSVNVSIGHNDHLGISQSAGIQCFAVIFCPNGNPQGGKDILDLLTVKDLMLHGLLHVENLSPERQYGLKTPVTALLGRAAGRITLYQEDLGDRGITVSTVGQLAWQP